MQRAVGRIERVVEGGHAPLALGVAGLLLLLQIPGIEDLAAEIGLENDTQLRTAGAIVILASILLELRQLNRRVTPAITGRQHFSDPKEMYNALIERAAEIGDPNQRRVDVLGLTLFSAWPELEFFLERPEISGWRIRLATLASDAPAPRHWVPETWPQESATTVNQARDFQARSGLEHDHQIEVFEYRFTPVIHGFRLGNGDVFLSALRWRDGRLGKHRFPYDYVPSTDVSPGADAARALFENWFQRAIRSAAEGPAGDDGANGDPAPPGETGR